jgi:hypothetical protein
MGLGLRHGRGYHEWVSETPMIDVVRTVIGVASVLVGCYAALCLILALQAGHRRTASENVAVPRRHRAGQRCR